MTIAPTAARGRRADARHVVAMQLELNACWCGHVPMIEWATP